MCRLHTQDVLREFNGPSERMVVEMQERLGGLRAQNDRPIALWRTTSLKQRAAASQRAETLLDKLRQEALAMWMGEGEKAEADVRELEAAKRASSRPVDPRAAIAFRVPEACFVRVARFLYHTPRPPPTPPPLDAEILGLLEGFVRRPPPPSSPG